MIKVTAAGNLTKDAEVFSYRSGNEDRKGVSFCLACNIGFGDNARTSFLYCRMYGRDENTARYLNQGNQLIVSGDLDINNVEGKTWVTCIVRDFDFGRKKNGTNANATYTSEEDSSGTYDSYVGSSAYVNDAEVKDDTYPF